jgi:hypothetical protein
MGETEELLAEATLGREAEAFLKSNLGRYITGCCEQEIKTAQDLLSTVSWWRHNRIKQLQNQVWRAKAFTQWLDELVYAGRAAEDELTQLEADD